MTWLRAQLACLRKRKALKRIWYLLSVRVSKGIIILVPWLRIILLKARDKKSMRSESAENRSMVSKCHKITKTWIFLTNSLNLLWKAQRKKRRRKPAQTKRAKKSWKLMSLKQLIFIKRLLKLHKRINIKTLSLEIIMKICHLKRRSKRKIGIFRKI